VTKKGREGKRVYQMEYEENQCKRPEFRQNLGKKFLFQSIEKSLGAYNNLIHFIFF
jgi:hypothetical protein